MKYPLFVDIDHTANYKTYRPTYPEKLYLSILEYYFDTTNHDIVNEGTKIPLALDVACGNGQATVDLSNYCQKIIGIDASQTQLDNAVRKDNIEYLCHNAEDLTFIESNTIDLITVATALHWFNIEEFFSQAKRILKPNHGVIAIWTYGIGTLNNPDATKLVCQFDEVDLADYWSDKRKLIDENYSSVLHLFPYEETRVKHVINCEKELSIRHYIKVSDLFITLLFFVIGMFDLNILVP